MFEYNKEKVRLIERTAPDTYIERTVVLKTHKQSRDRKLRLGKLAYTVPANVAPKLMQIKKNKFVKLFFMESGVLVEPSDELTKAAHPLLSAEQLRDAAEKGSLYELLHPNISKNEAILFFVIGAVVGASVGIVVAQNFLHLGAAAAVP